jgi:hypothetical protein
VDGGHNGRLCLILVPTVDTGPQIPNRLVRAADRGASTRAVLTCRFPFIAGARVLFPALSLFRSATPDHEVNLALGVLRSPTLEVACARTCMH